MSNVDLGEIKMELGLKDKVILITGSGGVLGAAFVKGFANLGSKLAVNDLKEEKAIIKSNSFECFRRIIGKD